MDFYFKSISESLFDRKKEEFLCAQLWKYLFKGYFSYFIYISGAQRLVCIFCMKWRQWHAILERWRISSLLLLSLLAFQYVKKKDFLNLSKNGAQHRPVRISLRRFSGLRWEYLLVSFLHLIIYLWKILIRYCSMAGNVHIFISQCE